MEAGELFSEQLRRDRTPRALWPARLDRLYTTDNLDNVVFCNPAAASPHGKDLTMPSSLNRVILLGNLTRDPETRQAGATTVCSLRLAVNDRVKNRDTGAWEDRVNYFAVTVFGAQGQRCAQYLGKGRQVAIDGRLHWRSWEAKDGTKHEAVEVVADSVQFIGAREGATASAASGRTPDQAAADPDDDISF